MLVRLHMSRDLVTLAPNARASEALALLQENSIRHAPVVDEKRLVGIGTDRDLLRALPTTVSQIDGAPHLDPLVASVMSKQPITIAPNDHVDDAARILLERRIHCLPVVQDGELHGIITDTDLFAVFARLLMHPGCDRWTFVHPTGKDHDPEFDLASEAVLCGLVIESLVRQEMPDGRTVTQIYSHGDDISLECFLERVADAGYTVLDTLRAMRRSA